jgi:hypothetical protein
MDSRLGMKNSSRLMQIIDKNNVIKSADGSLFLRPKAQQVPSIPSHTYIYGYDENEKG